jgi:hypothetical protein
MIGECQSTAASFERSFGEAFQRKAPPANIEEEKHGLSSFA